jgi:hypothetical protein
MDLIFSKIINTKDIKKGKNMNSINIKEMKAGNTLQGVTNTHNQPTRQQLGMAVNFYIGLTFKNCLK